MTIQDFKVGFFLTVRYIRGASKWTLSLVSFVMVLTFLNLTLIEGLLEGIVVGSLEGTRQRATGDVIVTPKEGNVFVERTQNIIAAVRNDARIETFSPRHRASIEVITEEDFYNVTDNNEKRKRINTFALGINPTLESETTNLASSLLEGSYFSSKNNRREILLGSALLSKYSPFGDDVLTNVEVGDSVFVRLGSSEANILDEVDPFNTLEEESRNQYRKYIVKGIFRTKARDFDFGVMMNEIEVRSVNNTPGNNVNQIALRLFTYDDANAVRDTLKERFSAFAKFETTDDAIGSFLNDIRTIFKTLGAVVGGIGLIVASITIFIVIFVITNSRKRFIGILKGIGLTPMSIRISYILFALFFAFIGTVIGVLLLNNVFVPYFEANPIPFPFSDGILFIDPVTVSSRVAALFVATFIAGFLPVHRVVRRPAVEGIMDR